MSSTVRKFKCSQFVWNQLTGFYMRATLTLNGLNVHHLNGSIYIWNFCNRAQFLNKKIMMKCLAIKVFAWNFFTTPNLKNIFTVLELIFHWKTKHDLFWYSVYSICFTPLLLSDSVYNFPMERHFQQKQSQC